MKRLATAARDRQRVAHRPGTIAGRASAVRLFLDFCKDANIQYKKIGYCHVCWYIERLAERGCTPGTISNHVSHLRTFYKLADLKDSALHHYRVRLALRAVAITIRTPSRSKLDVPPPLLRKALEANAGRTEHQATNLAFIIMYLGFLRQSSLAPPTKDKFDASRHPTNRDLKRVRDGLTLNLK